MNDHQAGEYVELNQTQNQRHITYNIFIHLNIGSIINKIQMQQEEICEILKQIIPELELKIREELKAEYEQRMVEIEKYYQNEIELLNQRQNQLQSQLATKKNSIKQIVNDKEKDELYKRVGILESQRKNWCTLQTQYQTTIQQLTNLLSTLSLSSRPAMEPASPISKQSANYTSVDFNSVNTICAPPKSSITVENLCRPTRKDRREQEIQIESKSSKEPSILQNSLYKYINNTGKETNEPESQSHYHSVLSPPKEDSSVQGKRIFWDENKKKQLLSLIKLN